MSLISVKAKPGRLVREKVLGKPIPSDRYVTLELTPRLRRFIEVWGDLEVEPKPAPTKTVAEVKAAAPVEKPKLAE